MKELPWCLWGHSGGAFWASLMQAKYPERIVAIWFRSGSAINAWEKGEIPRPELGEAVYGVPCMGNPGAKERDSVQFKGAWDGLHRMHELYRAQGAPFGLAPDPRTGHECGDSRYLAIPYFDACLAMRLPEAEGRPLRPVDSKAGWLAEVGSDVAVPAAEFPGDPNKAVWLPGEAFAKLWSEYVKTGAVSDSTPPRSPEGVAASRSGGMVTLTWEARADFESGLSGFVIERDGKRIATIPKEPVGRFGRPLFQAMSYHDTPEAPVPEMRFEDRDAGANEAHQYRVVAINGVGLESSPSEALAVGEN